MSDIINNAFNNIDPKSEKFVEKNTDIVEEIYALMERLGISSQKELAKLLAKNESEVSKMLSGIHNLTLRSITNLEVGLGHDIIMTASKAEEKFKKTVYMVHSTGFHRKYSPKLPKQRVGFKSGQVGSNVFEKIAS